MLEPDLVLIQSGKRKSGKDYVFQKLSQYLDGHSNKLVYRQIAISSELKKIYATANNLDFEKLLDSSPYKENYRLDMITWSDSIRARDPGYFCRKAVEMTRSRQVDPGDKVLIWFVTDVRRKTDLEFFRSTFPGRVKTIRVVADESVRRERKWEFTPGVDDSVSECDLDDVVDWDFVVSNNCDAEMKSCLVEIERFLDSVRKAS